LRKTDQVSPAVPADLDAQLEPHVIQARYEAVQRGVREIGELLRSTEQLDAIVMFGDDQHEQFDDGNMPAIAIYHGDDNRIPAPNREKMPFSGDDQALRAQLVSLLEPTREHYPNGAKLATHLITSLTDQDFDVTRCNRLRDKGIGHAFAFLYQRLWPECNVPVVPIMLNTYYPPNQPTPARSYALGAAVRRAIEAWDGGKRVAVIASGGLSHIVIDEPLDRAVLEALARRDSAALCSVPRAKMRAGTSEILNWIALGGTMGDDFAMTLVEYVPGYRSRPSTGCGMAFAFWQPIGAKIGAHPSRELSWTARQP
jgi:OH-DDVA oxygenase/3-O-methylgallate 3,4-dioxygenase